jgi:hypothetical protein
MHNEQILQQLRQGVEEAIDTKMRTPKDFDTLSETIYQKTHKRVSSSTLKRFWGYLSSVTVPRLSTLDILAQFIGYTDYESFCHKCEEDHLVQEPDNEPVELPTMPSADDEHGVDRKSFFSTPKAWVLYAIIALGVVGAAYWGLSHRQSAGTEESPYILKKGQTFATYQDYLELFGIHAEEYLWGQRLPHHPNISVWGPQYHHPEWHNDGDSALLLPTITERWEPTDGSADSVFIATRNSDRYLTYTRMNELRITFMSGLTPGDSLTFLGVYRLDLDHSDTHHLTWQRVADMIDLNRLDYLEELRN